MTFSLRQGSYMGQDKKHPQVSPDSQEKMLMAFMKGLPSVAVIEDLEGHILFVNPTWEKIFQKSRDEWLGKTADEIWSPKMAAKFNEHDQVILRTREPLLTVGTLLHTDGPHHWLSYRFPITDAGGEMTMIGINAIDITEHIETQARLEHWLDSSPTVIYIRKPRGNFGLTYISRNIRTLLGWEPRQFLEDPNFWFNHIHPDDQPRISSELTLPWPEDHQTQEYRLQAQDGAYHWVHDSFKMVRDRNGKPVEIAGSWLDITERKALEVQLLKAQRMEAVGRLAGGVAHDFNNLLMAIMGYSELMRTSLYQSDPLSHYVEDILKAADRAAALTQQLLAFSRQQTINPQVLNLNRVVADLEKMLRRLLGEHIDLEIRVDPDLKLVKADPGQLGQIILNLAVNARDAMTTGGKLTVETANIEFGGKHHCRLDIIPPGRYVRLTLKDSGNRLDAETLAHIFEPFYTTKEPGRGSGLGLPVVYGIVKQNGGYIDVESQPGEGTVFTVYLPVNETAEKPTRDRLPLGEKLEGSETILIVEDEVALRTLLSRFFRLYGYEVLEARDGSDALSICQQRKKPIHIMLSDVVMPRMNGSELAARLEHLHPEMQVFFMSGYTDSDLAPYGVLDPAKIVIAKPFRPLDMVKKVRECLDAATKDTNNSSSS